MTNVQLVWELFLHIACNTNCAFLPIQPFEIVVKFCT